jgi:UDP-N-acetylglucosamine 2-epimerase (non-hydrolysing)
MSRTVLSVVGARPQFVKAFPVSQALSDREVLVHTGQHYDTELSDVFFEELDIPEPRYNLGVGSGSHADQTAAVMRGLDAVLDEVAPDTVLVYGDTNSTLGAALTAAKRDPALAHVEAGLRSGNWEMPEEVNRVLTDRCSEYLFAPSERAVENLADEDITDGVHLVGDVMYDALEAVRDRVLDGRPPAWLDHDAGEYILATVHRAENTDDPARLATVVGELADAPLPVVFPAHPRTVEALSRSGLLAECEQALDVLDPVGYLDFLALVEAAERVATDSGGVQKEAVYLGTPCVTLREETEWVETVECGWNVLVGADPAAIRRGLRRGFSWGEPPSLYGDGTAAERIDAALH